jgi:peptidoglycan/LPS O-acetylase OafA/YrhL
VLAAIGLAAALAIGIVFTRVPSRPLFDVLTVLPFGLVVYGLAHTPSGGRGILSHPFLVLLGDASYSLYTTAPSRGGRSLSASPMP